MIKYDKRNYRKHDERNKALIKKSLEDCGVGRSIVIDNDNSIIAGNGVYEQAAALGLPVRIIETDGKELIAVKRTDINTDDDKRKQLAVMDNSTSDSSMFDFDLLQADFEIETLESWGIDVEALGGDIDTGEIVEDEMPEEVQTVCKRGDIWQLGNHRLMCGDSTSPKDVALLMDGNKADMVFTSPPYNAGKTPTEISQDKKSKYLNDIDNKTSEEYMNFLWSFTNIALSFAPYVFVNIQSLSNNKIALIEYLYRFKKLYADTIIWDKMLSQPAMAENVLNSQFEYIHIFSANGTRAIGVKPFRGTIKNIIHMQKQTRNEFSKIHNATFPLEFAVFFVSNFSQDSVLDLFGGSGTTLIACEQTGRKCYTMELDEHYCDVIITRFEQLTGQKAVKL